MTKSRFLLLLTGAVGLVLAAWVGWRLFGPGTAPAVWQLTSGSSVRENDTRIDVLVSRLGCNSGITGRVLEPEVQESPDEVIVSFRVSPGEPAEANCPGNAQEPFTIRLEDPMGQRRLIDGECLEQGAGAGTSLCKDAGIRYAP